MNQPLISFRRVLEKTLVVLKILLAMLKVLQKLLELICRFY